MKSMSRPIRQPSDMLSPKDFPMPSPLSIGPPHRQPIRRPTTSSCWRSGERVKFDVMCLIQATSPLTQAEDFVQAKDKFISGSYDSLLSAVPFNRFLWDADEKPINYDPARRPRRQDAAVQYMENGAFYFTTAELLEKSQCRLGARIGIHVMPLDTACEIDEPRDWAVCEQLLLGRSATQLQHALSKIEALVVDVDGTLTDGGMYYGADGEALKKFHTP